MSDTVTTEEPKAKPGPKPKAATPPAEPAPAQDPERAAKLDAAHAARMAKEPERAIPIKRIRLKYGERVDLPGKEGANALDDNRNEKHKAKRWAIDYLPAMRQVRVKHWNADAPTKTVLIPEVWVMKEVEE